MPTMPHMGFQATDVLVEVASAGQLLGSRSWRTGGAHGRPLPSGSPPRVVASAAAGSVGGGAVEVSGAVGSVDGDDSVFVEGESPASFVNQMVMFEHNGSRLSESVLPWRSQAMTWWMSHRSNVTSQPG